jgi:hypothetical protein
VVGREQEEVDVSGLPGRLDLLGDREKAHRVALPYCIGPRLASRRSSE